jgi:hypothetical protein
MKGKVWLCAAVSVALLASAANADDLLIVDLSVVDQVTITATDGLSAATVSGSDSIGVYFEGFYGVAGNSLNETLVSGDLTNAENPASNSPNLYRAGSGSDPGLNIYSWSSDSTVSFTMDSLAFVGSGTWDLDADDYADMLAGAVSGDLYFPADSEDDIAGATMLGTYRVIPEPATLSLLGLLGLVVLRRR